jgi:hypothetical protein
VLSTASRVPVAASRRLKVATDGCFDPRSYAEIVACDVPVRCASSAWLSPARVRASKRVEPASTVRNYIRSDMGADSRLRSVAVAKRLLKEYLEARGLD